MNGWQQARHETGDRSRASYRTSAGGEADAQASRTGFTSARQAMGDAQEAGPLVSGEMRYVVGWAEERDQQGSGAASSWVPMPFGPAKAILPRNCAAILTCGEASAARTRPYMTRR